MVADSSEDVGDPDMDKITYCLCGTTYDPNIFMIQCDICKDWFHGSCCNFQEYTAIEVERFHCPRCETSCGPSVYKPYVNGHRYDYWDENAALKAVQTGTPVFVRELCARHFRSDSEVVLHMAGHEVTDTYLLQNGFDHPILIDNPEGLEMTIPPPNFSLYDVEAFIGANTEIDVIDVTRQADLKMKLKEYVAYYNSLYRRRIFNVISLEFSNFALGRLVEAPAVVRKLDWSNCMWPHDYYMPPPQVQKYCLMSVQNSYTDFHVDFGGTSVWYHVLRGEKVFYFIKPNAANLTLYQQWMTSTNQSETFFGDQADCCYKCILRQGQTMLIPTGWIHAVYTPTDSLVFGGNFLHSLNIPMQLQIYEIERKIKTIEKFRYPYFECMFWFAAQNMHSSLKELNSEELRCPASLLEGLKSIVASLKRWINNKYHSYYGRTQVPLGINHSKLLKDIGKEIRHAERLIHLIEPPKPERESKRTRKRPFNKDFVDYSLSLKSSPDPYGSQPKLEESPRIPPLKLTLPKPSMYPYKTLASKKKPVELAPENSVCDRPEITTAIHRGGTVLQFRLGTKDYFARTQSDEVSSTSNKSIYDFHDDSEREGSTAGNTPKRAKKLSKRRISLKQKHLNDKWIMTNIPNDKETECNIDLQFPSIESLDTLDNSFTDNEAETEESFYSVDASALTGSLNDATVSSVSSVDEPPRPEDENISKVHQDDDYIYPSLDNSDDEDVQVFKPRGRSRIDEPWSPKARVGPLLPKMNRPTREGTKKQAVEKVLEAAAAKRASEAVEMSPKRHYRKRKPKPKPEKKKSPQPSTSTSGNATTPTTPVVQKQRKGMKTVKQRLGKILKIHKMMH